MQTPNCPAGKLVSVIPSVVLSGSCFSVFALLHARVFRLGGFIDPLVSIGYHLVITGTFFLLNPPDAPPLRKVQTREVSSFVTVVWVIGCGCFEVADSDLLDTLRKLGIVAHEDCAGLRSLGNRGLCC